MDRVKSVVPAFSLPLPESLNGIIYLNGFWNYLEGCSDRSLVLGTSRIIPIHKKYDSSWLNVLFDSAFRTSFASVGHKHNFWLHGITTELRMLSLFVNLRPNNQYKQKVQGYFQVDGLTRDQFTKN